MAKTGADRSRVFCEDCKHYSGYVCKKVLLRTKKIKPEEICTDITYAVPSIDNKDNSCKYYEFDSMSEITAILIIIISVFIIIYIILYMILVWDFNV
ncbi:hypothetical protein GQ472_06080 [archaeon]|nr:hypothetical protein [archaeon]